MKHVSFAFGCALSFALLGIGGCAIDEGDQKSASDEVASDTLVEHFDSERAAAIAKTKMALIGANVIAPQAAACGRKGSTSTSVRDNDAAFTGGAQQRNGSSISCTAVGVLQPTDDALYFCYTSASDGTWTYNQNIRTGVRGWTRDDLLRGDGSFTPCGF